MREDGCARNPQISDEFAPNCPQLSPSIDAAWTAPARGLQNEQNETKCVRIPDDSRTYAIWNRPGAVPIMMQRYLKLHLFVQSTHASTTDRNDCKRWKPAPAPGGRGQPQAAGGRARDRGHYQDQAGDEAAQSLPRAAVERRLHADGVRGPRARALLQQRPRICPSNHDACASAWHR